MARDDEKRKSLFDDEDEDDSADEQRLKAKRTGLAGGKEEKNKLFSGGVVDSQTIDQKLADVKAIMDQTHALYQHYFNGIERRPPIDKARLLESRIAELQRVQSSTPTAKFKISQFILQYHTFRDLWDRKLRDKERA